MTGYESKRAAARDKLVDDRRAYYEKFDDLYAVYLNGVYDGKKAAQRPWADLTDEEITKTYWSREPFKRPTLIGFAREIEQLLKEKNNG